MIAARQSVAALAAIFLTGATPKTPVAIELVLALDSSASVDNAEFQLQLQGVAEAFADTEVLEAVDRLKPFGAAVTIIQWGGPGETRIVVPFTHLEGARDAKAFSFVAKLIRRWNRASSTSIATAIADGEAMLDGNGFEGSRRTIDISGDGPDNSGLDIAAIRQHAIDAGIVINGLAIESDDKKLSVYYRDNVIGGDFAFVETATGFDDFRRAIKEKLLRELRPPES